GFLRVLVSLAGRRSRSSCPKHGLASVSLWTQLAHHVFHHADRSSCSRPCSCPLGLFLNVSLYRSDRIQNRCEDKDDCLRRWRAGVLHPPCPGKPLLCRHAAAAQLRYCRIYFSEMRRTSSFMSHLQNRGRCSLYGERGQMQVAQQRLICKALFLFHSS
uniref:Uncharacterized protein n=1 Tax=Aquila chrysaetos chrysaetos TaxID=223781 RepID=A0A663EPL7_AQUCH